MLRPASARKVSKEGYIGMCYKCSRNYIGMCYKCSRKGFSLPLNNLPRKKERSCILSK